MAKSSTGTRIAEIILGAISIVLAGFIIANPASTAIFLIMILGYGLIFVGIARIVGGFTQSGVSAAMRAISIGTGALSIIGGTLAVWNPLEATAILIFVVTIFIMIHGFGLIGSGIGARGIPKGPRIGIIIMGIIAVGFSSILLAMPGLAVELVILFMSISLFFNGIGSIVSGITGNKQDKYELQ